MRFRAILLSVLLIAVAGCTDVDTPAASPSSRAAGVDDAGCEPRFLDALDQFADRGFSGSVAVRLGGTSSCRWAGGLADHDAGRANTVDTVFSIGSIAKTFTAATVLALADEGVLAVDDPLSRWLPELDGPAAETIHGQLLAHTGGLGPSHGRDHQPLTETELLEALGVLQHDPGTEFAYSNTGYSALALIIERASGRPFREALADTVLRPPFTDGGLLGGWWDGEPGPVGERAVGTVGDRPGHPGDFDGPHWALDGNGGLAMSMPELANWVDELTAGQIIPQPAVDNMFTTAWDHGDGTGETFGWVVIGQEGASDHMYGVSGGGGQIGHEASVLWMPELDAVVAVAANTPTVAPATIVEGVITALLDNTDLAGPPATADADTALLAQVSDRYELDGGGTFVVEPTDDGFRVRPLDGPALVRFLPPPNEGDAAAHGDDVEEFLFGRTPAGEEEQEALESLLGGPLTEIERLGTAWIEGELRTYVIVRSATGEETAWIALEPAGGLAAAEVPASWPTIDFVAASPSRFVASDDRISPVVVDVTDPAELRIDGRDGSVTATQAETEIGSGSAEGDRDG